MTIGFDFRMGGSINSGIGRYIFELLKKILEHDQQNQYYIFYNSNNVDQNDLRSLQTFPNVTLVSSTARHYSLNEQIKFLWLLYKYKLDLVHFPNFNVPVLYRRPFVVTIHDMVHHKISGHKKSTKIFFYGYKFVINMAARMAQRIITVTNYAKQEIEQYLRVPPEKISVIYEAPFLTQATEQSINHIKQKYNIHKPYFLFVGTLERKKNVPSLSRGFDEFVKKYGGDYQLVIAGKPDKHYPHIVDDIRNITHQDKLILTGFVNDDDLAALYSGAFAFTTASLHEGFGLPGVEAMQYGVPVLASSTEVFKEVYGSAALYFDPLNPSDVAEKMHQVTTNSNLYRQLQELGRERVKIFDWDKAAKQTLEVYREVLKS